MNKNKNSIEVNDLGISFTNHNLKPSVFSLLKKPIHTSKETGYVFRHLNFTVKKGKVLGIIGRNGCGKTTLLKIISRVLFPSEGNVKVYGSVASLLGVGTGFHDNYTGRENIILNGQLLGVKKSKIEQKIDEIIDFSELGNKVEDQVRTYSSGMKARLAFSVATLLDADTIILDEILSVGDAGFQAKCLNVIEELKNKGKTIIIVSHSMGSIERFCDRAILIQNGSITADGDPFDITANYLNQFKPPDEKTPILERTDRFGNARVQITDIKFKSKGSDVFGVLTSGEDMTVKIKYEVKDSITPKNLEIGVSVKDRRGLQIVRFSTDAHDLMIKCKKNNGSFSVLVKRLRLTPGIYTGGFRLVADDEVADHIPNAFKFEVLEGSFFETGKYNDWAPVYLDHQFIDI